MQMTPSSIHSTTKPTDAFVYAPFQVYLLTQEVSIIQSELLVRSNRNSLLKGVSLFVTRGELPLPQAIHIYLKKKTKGERTLEDRKGDTFTGQRHSHGTGPRTLPRESSPLV